MRRWAFAVLFFGSVLFVSRAAAAPSATHPTPRAVAEAMRACWTGPLEIVGPSDPAEAGAVIVVTARGTFGIKEFTVTRARGWAAVMVSRDPDFALLHITFPERSGGGRIDTVSDDPFQREAVDCFYGNYLGVDIVR